MSTMSTTTGGSVDRSRAFLVGVADSKTDLLSAQVSLDRCFGTIVSPAEVRASIRLRTGTDIGFDFGVEAFSSMIGLTLSPHLAAVVPPTLVRDFTRRAQTCRRGNRFGYFIDTPEFASDTDCTALAAATLYEHDLMTSSDLADVSKELVLAAAPCAHQLDGAGDVHPGVVMVYWDDGNTDRAAPHRGRKHDAVACANVLYTLALAEESGVGVDTEVVDATVRHVGDHLLSRRYLAGTRYYPAPEVFLYATARLCARFDDHARLLGPGLRRELSHARDHPVSSPLDLALSIITADTMGVGGARRERLADLARLQQHDGSWPAASYYRMGRFPVYFGSPLITTLFAMRAMQADPAAETAT
jgi:hypothetical protein